MSALPADRGRTNMKRMIVKRILLTLAMLGMASTWFGCHTAHGFGEDVENAGQKIQQHTP
jgi:predicted small secreted protein